MSPRPPADAEYRSFPNGLTRNGLHAALEVPMLVRTLALPRGGRVLEIGCGRGVALPVLARLLRPSLLVGLDVDSALLGAAAERLAAFGVTADLVHGDVRHLPFPDASFDLVVDFGTCYHIADAAAALREVARVLDADGLFAHETPVSQRLAHPVRSARRVLPWRAAPLLAPHRTAVLWSARRKRAPRGNAARGAARSVA